jgi:hypothetical protein
MATTLSVAPFATLQLPIKLLPDDSYLKKPPSKLDSISHAGTKDSYQLAGYLTETDIIKKMCPEPTINQSSISPMNKSTIDFNKVTQSTSPYSKRKNQMR